MSATTDFIPAIDIIGGRCVRLTKGDYSKQSTYGDPVAMAQAFEDAGCKRLHVVDLDGARSKHIVNSATLRAITSATHLIVDFGGGIKSDEDIEEAFDSGAAMVTIGSVAITNPEKVEQWIGRYGAERIILGADARYGRIAINGWQEDSGEELAAFIRRYVEKGISKALCTDISRDGTLAGPNLALYKSIMSTFPTLYLIVSGGISSAEDLKAVEAAGLPAVVFGKAFYEGKITLEDIRCLQRG